MGLDRCSVEDLYKHNSSRSTHLVHFVQKQVALCKVADAACSVKAMCWITAVYTDAIRKCIANMRMMAEQKDACPHKVLIPPTRPPKMPKPTTLVRDPPRAAAANSAGPRCPTNNMLMKPTSLLRR